MVVNKSLVGMAEKIQDMRRIAEQLTESGKGTITLERNLIRILSAVRLLDDQRQLEFPPDDN